MRRFAAVALAALAVSLASACSGGGGGSPSLSLSQTSVAVEASSEDTRVDDVYVELFVDDMPGSGVWVAVESEGDAIQLAEFDSPEGTNGYVQIAFPAPTEMGAGEYTGTVTVSVCRDEACSKHITNSPAVIPVTLTVTGPDDAVPLVDSHALAHDVVDAEYSAALDVIVMVSALPTPTLQLYDPVQQTAKSIALDAAPKAVSVGPDGLSAAVGHDGLITIVDLANIEDPIVSPKTVLDLSTGVTDIVLAGNGYVHAFPSNAYTIRSVEIATNTETGNTGYGIYYGTKAKLHPDGTKMYGANNGLSPDSIERYGVAAGIAANESSSSSAYYERCGDLWLPEDGLTIYTACGTVLRAADVASRDMVYAGTLDIPDAARYGRRIRSLSHSTERHEVALLDDVSSDCDLNPPVCSTLRLYDSDYLDLVGQYRLLAVKVGDAMQRQRGLFVFHSADGSARYLISKLQSGAYLVSTLGLPAHEPDLSPPPVPVVTPSAEEGLTAAPLGDFAALAHDVVDAAFSAALNSVVMISTYPSNAVHVHDMTTGADRTIALTQEPRSLSLSPDGLSASVGQVSLIAVVDLAPGGAEPTLLPTAYLPGAVVMGGSGYVYTVPREGGLVRFRSINVASGVETQNNLDDVFGSQTTARLHPAGSKMYGYDSFRRELTSFPIVLGIAEYGDDSSYNSGDYSICGNQWFSESGALIYTACGNTFTASDIASEDMLYVGTLEMTQPGTFNYQVASLSDSVETQEAALIEYTPSPCVPGSNPYYGICRSHLNVYDNASLAREASYSFSPLGVGAKSYLQQGRFIFHSADGTQRYVISQLHGMPNPETEFYISRMQ
jgi:hypothetical protein